MPQGISVLGLGNWGTALGNHLAVKGFEVTGWTVEQDVFKGINEHRKNPRYLSTVDLSPRLQATMSLEDALKNRVVVMVVPSSVLAQVLGQIKSINSEHVLVSAIKGIDPHSLSTPLQLAESILGLKHKYAVLSGPSFAKDVVVQRPCGVVSASGEDSIAREVAEIFSSDSMKVYPSDDPLGVEIGGITKNVIALAAGVCDGLNLGESARAGLITRGLAEMMRLAGAMGAKTQTLAGLSGLGDLAMTATSEASRNRTVGLRLGQGEKLKQIVASLGSVAEAVTTTPLVLKLAEKYKADMPITEHVSKLINDQISAPQLAKALIARPMRKEFD